MRVLYLALDVKLGDVSGDAIHVKEVCRALALLGVQVHLVVPDLDGSRQRSDALEQSGVVIHSIPVAGDVRTALICRRLATKSGSDVIFERRFSPKVGVVASRASGLPLVVEINGLPDVEMEILGRSAPGSEVSRALKFRLAVTPGLAAALHDRFGILRERLVVIPNGADVEAFRPGDVVAAKEALGVLSSRANIGFVGTLYPWHGLHHLLAASAGIVRESPSVLFTIVGDGPERHRLESLAAEKGLRDHFLFTGRVDHGQVPALLQSFDVCVHLVASELYAVPYGSSALKLYEYMASGKPIVAARYPGFEVIEEVDCGLLVDPRDPAEVTRAIVSLLRDPARRESMGRRARQVAVEQYSWNSVAQRLLAVMRDLSG
jgi:glycosyltransferase involved in cell wall biosynthesis